jgi:hypothetical protein
LPSECPLTSLTVTKCTFLQASTQAYDTLPLTAKGDTLYNYTVALIASEVYVNNLPWINFYVTTATFHYVDWPALNA